jgi:hypothetical protein
MRHSAAGATVLTLVLAVVAAPEVAEGQQVDGWWDWAHRDLIEVQRRGSDVRGGGPPFCRTGQGHPVHGRRWCLDRGFGLGSGRVFDGRWDRRGWEDIVLRVPRERDRRRGALDRGGLIDVLGDVVFRRLAAESAGLGAGEPLVGRWIEPERGASVLQIRSGRIPIAELSDLNGSGRVDVVLIARPGS